MAYTELKDVVILKQRKNQPVCLEKKLDQWLDARIEKTEACWLWTGHKIPKGYGTITIGRTADRKVVTGYAHRLMFQGFNGEIPDGFLTLHECDNPSCVNPLHLFAGTSKENTDDMFTKGRAYTQQKTHCAQGHEFTPENTMFLKRQRACKTCRAIRQREYRAGKRILVEQ